MTIRSIILIVVLKGLCFCSNAQNTASNADWAHFIMDYETADSLYSEILDKNPEDIDALNGKAMIAFDHEHIDNSIQILQKALEIDSSHITTWINYSKVLLENRDSEGSITAINKALEIDSLNSDALAGKGFYLSAMRYSIDEGAIYFNKAIASNPSNWKAHHYLGRGYSPGNYNHHSQPTNKRLATVDSLLRENRFESAHKLISIEYSTDSSNLDILKLKAASEFHMGNFRRTIDHSFRILELRPNYGLAHYFIAESIMKLKSESNILMKEFKIEFERSQVPEDIPFLEDVFINYNQCGDDLRKIIRTNAKPLSGFMEALSLAGATVYFMDFHHLLFECPYLADLKGSRAVDLRLADDLKGQGGYHMSSNKLQQSEVMYGKYNVAFHEFGHLIHWLFTREQNRELKRLFIKAKKGHYTLDWYADLNEKEYFAQGIEAYLSERKLPGLSAAMNNTKRKLYNKDIDLYNFIESLLNQESYEHHMIQAYILKSWYIDSADDALLLLNNAAQQYPESPDLLIEMGNIYRDKGDTDKAEKVHQQAIESFPDNLQAQLELSYDIFLQDRNAKESIKILEAVLKDPEFGSKMYKYLGLYYTKNGEFHEAIEMLEVATTLDPYPDPYDISLPDPYFLLGKAQIMAGAFVDAHKNLQNSLNVDRGNAETYAELAFVNLQLKNPDEAVKFISTAIQLDPTNKRVLEVEMLLKSN